MVEKKEISTTISVVAKTKSSRPNRRHTMNYAPKSSWMYSSKYPWRGGLRSQNGMSLEILHNGNLVYDRDVPFWQGDRDLYYSVLRSPMLLDRSELYENGMYNYNYGSSSGGYSGLSPDSLMNSVQNHPWILIFIFLIIVYFMYRKK